MKQCQKSSRMMSKNVQRMLSLLLVFGMVFGEAATTVSYAMEAIPDSVVVNSEPEKPTESAPTEGAPTEGAPTEGAPTEGAPTESAPTEGAPTEGAPTESAPTEGTPTEGVPSNNTSSDPKQNPVPLSAESISAIAVVTELINKLPADVPTMPETEAAYTVWLQLMRTHQADVKTAWEAYTLLSAEEKLVLGTGLCAIMEEWANAMAGVPTDLTGTLANVYVKANGNDTNTGASDSPFLTLRKAYEAVAENGTIHVDGTVSVPTADNMNVSKTINIVGTSSGEIKRAAGNTGVLISVADMGNVTLTDIAIDGGATYTGGITKPENITDGGFLAYRGGQLTQVNTGGVLTLGSGAILRDNAIIDTGTIVTDAGKALDYGSAVHVNGGTLNIGDGSQITGNLLSGYAADGAAFTLYNNGTVNMDGGAITNNYGERIGSIIRLVNGTCNLSGGSISGNLGSDKNDAPNQWYIHNAVYVPTTAVLKVSGNIVIDDNMHTVGGNDIEKIYTPQYR